MRFPSPLYLLACCLLGCPAEVPKEQLEPPKRQQAVSPDDPRVIQDGADLYPDPNREPTLPTKQEPLPPAAEGEVPRGPGSGAPDETNGVCRLFAPKLPQPECCLVPTGFDVEAAQKACGRELYLGEHFHYSCGYYFHDDGGKPAWFRVAFVPGSTPKEAASTHDARLRRATKDETFASKPIAGVPGALMSSYDGMNWAFLPGWPQVRLMSWRDTACSRKNVIPLLKRVMNARKPKKNEERPGLIPKAL